VAAKDEGETTQADARCAGPRDSPCGSSFVRLARSLHRACAGQIRDPVASRSSRRLRRVPRGRLLGQQRHRRADGSRGLAGLSCDTGMEDDSSCSWSHREQGCELQTKAASDVAMGLGCSRRRYVLTGWRILRPSIFRSCPVNSSTCFQHNKGKTAHAGSASAECQSARRASGRPCTRADPQVAVRSQAGQWRTCQKDSDREHR
jgi:hypothetical protein